MFSYEKSILRKFNNYDRAIWSEKGRKDTICFYSDKI